VRSLKNVNLPWKGLHQVNDHFESKHNAEVRHYRQTLIRWHFLSSVAFQWTYIGHYLLNFM